jgi:glycosyltransferase involved in cell wall biosynthesis
MDRPLISCVVPTYNSERYLRAALDSVLAQTYRPLQMIVADDGSLDATIGVVAGYGEQVELVCQPTAGPAATRNLGLRAARGELVAFLDADDLWHPEKLARQAACFDARPELDVCVTYVQMFWGDDLTEEATHYRDHPRVQPVPGYATTTLLARRRVFDVLGTFNTALWFGDATEWFIRATERAVVMEIIPDALTYHRMHRTNLTRRRRAASREEFLHIVKALLDRRRGRH